MASIQAWPSVATTAQGSAEVGINAETVDLATYIATRSRSLGGAGLVMEALAGTLQGQRETMWFDSLVQGLGCVGVEGVQELGPELTLEQLGEKLGLGPFPGDLELVVLVSGTIMPFSRMWPVTPSAAAALNRAVAGLPGARSGVMAVELGAGPTGPPHGQYAYVLMMSAVEVAEVAENVEKVAAALGQPIDAAESRRQALESVRRLTARKVGFCLESEWCALGDLSSGFLDIGLATACSPSQALKIIELLLVYPWKCLVHLREDELGLGLGVCTLGLSAEAVEAALRFARCKELDVECIRGSGCDGHAHCRPRLYANNVGSYASCIRRAMDLGMRFEPAVAVFGEAVASIEAAQEVLELVEQPADLHQAVEHWNLCRREAGRRERVQAG
eukprot:XP_001695475.1 predicted protein [Chlamydomonas reinhardtii]